MNFCASDILPWNGRPWIETPCWLVLQCALCNRTDGSTSGSCYCQCNCVCLSICLCLAMSWCCLMLQLCLSVCLCLAMSWCCLMLQLCLSVCLSVYVLQCRDVAWNYNNFCQCLNSLFSTGAYFLGACAKLRKASFCSVMSVRLPLPAYPQKPNRLLKEDFSWDFIFENFSKNLS
jgi:hypothetical protein